MPESTGQGGFMRITRRSILVGAVAAPFVARTKMASAQHWPSGVIKIIVPFPPGGTVDPIARLAQTGLQQRLGATVIIENRPGASGSTGAGAVAKSAPDGNSWLFVFDTHAVNPFLQNLPFDTEKDLDPVVLIGTAPNVLATHPSRPYKTLQDVIDAAKAKPDTLNYGSVGAGSVGHLTMVQLTKRAGIKMVHVPYRGGGPAMNDAIAGHVDFIIGSAALVMPQVSAGTIRPLLQTGATRMPTLPAVPNAIESGFAGFESDAWWGVFAPAGTPKPINERFGNALIETLREPGISKQISENLQVSMLLGGPEDERKFLRAQMDLWGPVVKENNIRGE
jgi:tripartite-type tricarboxylate transporter receptor subunit TctC